MQWLLLIAILLFLITPSGNGQSMTTKPDGDNALAIEKITLLSNLQSLEAESAKLMTPLARALANAEIADVAWNLDQAWAKKLLREAYELTLPDEKEQTKLRAQPAGAPPVLPTGTDRTRSDVRNRVLGIAGRDKAFANQLAQLGAQQLGSYEEHFRYASLAAKAIKAGETEAASKYLLQSINADPTQITAGGAILDLASRDRKAADKLILQYIERLRAMPLSVANQSAYRTYIILGQMVSPNPKMFSDGRQIPPPSSAVIRETINYVIESMSAMEQREPGSAMQLRVFLLPLWLPLKQYAPELAGAFLELEKLSRQPGEDASLPYKSGEEASKERYEKRLKDALDSGEADELTINFAISRGDFERARKLIAKLPDGAQKTQFTEMVNTKEAVQLAARGDTLGAERLADQLTRAVSLLEAYPAIIKRCVADKNQTCVTLLVHKAVRQLKRADLTPNTPPAGIPMSIVPSHREFDPVLASLSKLAGLIAPLDEPLALEILDEVIATANASLLDTEQGRAGIDVELFRQLALRNEVRVRQAAESLQDRLRRIVATSAIYQARAAELAKAAKK